MTNTTSKNNRVFIATPVHNHTVHVKFMASLMSSCQKLLENGYSYLFQSRRGALINRTRNELVADFLHSDCDYFYFCDSDGYGFENNLLICLNKLNSLSKEELGKTIVGGSYAIKSLDLDRYHSITQAAIIQNKQEELSYQNMANYLLRYNVNYLKKDISIQDVLEVCRKKDGWISVKHLGGAYHVMHRSVLENLIKTFPECKYTAYDNEKGKLMHDHLYNFYHSFVSEEDGHYISEDYGFTELVNKMGGQALCNLNFNLGHCGSYDFEGSPLNHVEYVAENIYQQSLKKDDKSSSKTKKK